jgi:hypothetical protein
VGVRFGWVACGRDDSGWSVFLLADVPDHAGELAYNYPHDADYSD